MEANATTQQLIQQKLATALFVYTAPVAGTAQYGRHEQDGRGCDEQTHRHARATLVARAYPYRTHEALC